MIASDIPPGWKLVPLGQLANPPEDGMVSGPFGSNLLASEYVDSGQPVVRLQNISRGEFLPKNLEHVTEEKARQLSAHTFAPGDILITKLGDPLGKACVAPKEVGPGVVTADIIRVRPGPAVDTTYLMWAVNAPRIARELVGVTGGTTRPRVRLNHFREMEIPLAPLPEQRRIVEAIEANFARLEVGEAALDQTARIVESYWLSVLQAAFSGGLTVESASGLTYEERANQGLPQGWCLASIGELKQFSMYGPRFSSDEYSQDGTAIVRTTDMREDASIDFSESPRVPLTAKNLERYRLQRGDLLITRTGSLGTLAVYNGEPDAIAGAFLIQYRLKAPVTTVRYVAYWLRSPSGRTQLLSHAAGSGRPNLSSPGIDSISVPLAPMEEQSVILERLDEHYSWVLTIRDAIRKSRAKAIRVREGILRSAFSGRLVPQDLSDEPASALLERIKRERSSPKPVPTVRRSKRVAPGAAS